MTIKFKFKYERKASRAVTLSPNMMLAHSDMVKRKVLSIMTNLLFMIMCGFLCINCEARVVPLFNRDWYVIFAGATGLFFALLVMAILWDGPRAVKLIACVSTEGFEDYIEGEIKKLQAILSTEYIMIAHPTKKVLKEARKTLISAEILREMVNDSENFADLDEWISVISGSTKLYGFCFEEVKDYGKKLK